MNEHISTFSQRVRSAIGRVDLRQGLQLAAVVILAYAAALALGLPEKFWAPMSALIVMRPVASMTLDTGWSRIAATVVGACCGIAGTLLQGAGVSAVLVTLAIVCALAFVSASMTNWRTAPIAALIVLGAAATPGHSAYQVAFLRVMQIGIGVAVAMAISLLTSRHRGSDRLRSGITRILRATVKRLSASISPDSATHSDGTSNDANAVRDAIGRLNILAASVDRSAKERAISQASSIKSWQEIVAMIGRTVQDVGTLIRLMRVEGQENAAETGTAVRIVAQSLARTADALESGQAEPVRGESSVQSLQNEVLEDKVGKQARMTAGLLRLLSEDLAMLEHAVKTRLAASTVVR